MLKDRFLADMPIVVAAIDPCFSCTDRLVHLEYNHNKSEVIGWPTLRDYSIAWHKEHGIDFSVLNKKLLERMNKR